MINRSKDLTGIRKGKIKITSFKEIKKNGSAYWNYLCDCGKKGAISTGEFNRNRTEIKSCGCLKPHIDLSEVIFGKLVAKSISYKKGYTYYWKCICECGREISVRQELLTRNKKKDCGVCKYENKEFFNKKRKNIIDKVHINKNGCWIWKGPKDKDGYGFFGCSKIDQRAHRASYKLFVGEIPKNLWVLHKCDVHSCVNPDHLYIGDVKQNVKDAMDRGQFPKGPNLKKGHIGSKNCKSKLLENDVREIRKLSKLPGFKTKIIAKKYSVHVSSIQNLLARRTWKHI